MFERIEKHPIVYLFFFAVTLLIFVPCIIAWLINIIPFNLTSSTDNSDWLAFWATFAGNVIGLFGLTLVTVYQDRKQKKYINEQNKRDNLRLRVEMTSTALKETLFKIYSLNRDIKIKVNLFMSKSSALLVPDIEKSEALELNQFAFISFDELTHIIDELIETVKLSEQLSDKNKADKLPELCNDLKNDLREFINMIRSDVVRSEKEIYANNLDYKRLVNSTLKHIRDIDLLVSTHYMLQTKYYIELVNLEELKNDK